MTSDHGHDHAHGDGQALQSTAAVAARVCKGSHNRRLRPLGTPVDIPKRLSQHCGPLLYSNIHDT